MAGRADRLARSLHAAIPRAIVVGFGLFALVNVVAAVANKALLPAADPGPLERYGMDRLRTVYGGRSELEISSLLRETWGPQQLEYHPHAQFRSTARRGRFVNVSTPGYRHVSMQRPWPPPAGLTLILFFGGSTAFGLGVSDEETVASRLQERLASTLPSTFEIGVYNFGTPAHFSLQEAALLQSLLTSGIRPRLVVFLDGLNEFAFPGEPEWTTLLRDLSSGHIRCPLLDTLPIVRLARELKHRSRRAPEPADGVATSEGVIQRWLLNARVVRGLAREFGFDALWVWQPVPTYGYDLNFHGLFDGSRDYFGRHRLSVTGYPIAKALHDAGRFGEDVLWLGELQRGRKENFYVDQCHYTAAFNAEIAERIADAVAPLLAR